MKSMSQLEYHFGIKMRCYPDYRQKAIIRLNSDKSRFFYNYQIGLDKYSWDIKRLYGLKYYYNPLIQQWYQSVNGKREFTYAKKTMPFIGNKKVDSLAMANAKQNHNRAWQNYRSGLQGIPTFHAKKRHPYEWKYQTNCVYRKYKGKHIGSARFIDRKHFQVPKLGTVKLSFVRNCIWNKRNVIRIGTVTVRKDNLNHYYISLQLASGIPFKKPLPKADSKLGYDLNTSNFLADTNSKFIDNPRYYQHQLKRLRRVQRIVSRRYRHNKGHHLRTCKNYQEMRHKLARVAQHVYNQRKDFLNNLSTKLVETQDFLAGEELRSKNMLRNAHHNRSIQDVGWKLFINMLQYKCKLYGKHIELVNPAYTTQRCHNCGYICNYEDGTHLDESQRSWICPKCYRHHIRDVNAAINILQRGIKQYKRKVRMATSGR